MNKKTKNILKFCIGLVISIVFIYLAFHQVDIQELREVIVNSNIALLILAVIVLFGSHWLRAVRHRYFLEPIKRIENSSLFSALMIGYMANTFLPAHLGELLRAYVIGKKSGIAGSSVFATVIVERIIDTISLLIIMGCVFLVYPFPEIIKISAYLTFIFVIGLVGILVLMKLKPQFIFRFINIIIQLLPEKIQIKILDLLNSFREGIVTFKNRRNYYIVFILSILIWLGYTGVFAIGFYALDFINIYTLPIGASLVVLVVTTISILVPSSPGYVGTYHWLCIIALDLFNIPESPALGYAIVLHAISMLPVAFLGVIFAFKEGINISNVMGKSKMNGLVVTE